MDRRTLMQMSLAAATASAAGQGTARAAVEAAKPLATNPYAARPAMFTVATADIDASIRFYRDLLDHDLVDSGVLGAGAPGEIGARAGGRYALLQGRETVAKERGVMRLIETPPGAASIRPWPGASVMDPGLDGLNLAATDLHASYARLTGAGVRTISKPQRYSHDAVPPLPGSVDQLSQAFEISTYVAFGPSNERLYITRLITIGGKPFVPNQPRMHTPAVVNSIMCLDRWPLWTFYDAAFGLKPTKDQYACEDTLNTLIGAPPHTYFRFGSLGDLAGVEWWEFRQAKPPGNVYPTSLDRTGLAMSTLLVNDFAAVSARLSAANIPVLSRGALPTTNGLYKDSLFVRGPVGELIEVIGRT